MSRLVLIFLVICSGEIIRLDKCITRPILGRFTHGYVSTTPRMNIIEYVVLEQRDVSFLPDRFLVESPVSLPGLYHIFHDLYELDTTDDWPVSLVDTISDNKLWDGKFIPMFNFTVRQIHVEFNALA